jgi:prepilin-type N-terminal cleavage/methylation domain-containing protein
MRRVLSDQRGMTLAEVLVALPIITIGLLALLSAIPISTYATKDGSQTSTATFLANQRLEQVRNAQWSAVCHVDPVTFAVGPGADVTDTVGVSASPTTAPKDPSNAVTFADESSVAAAPTCTAAGVMSGTGIRRVTVTVTYTPLSATGTNAISGTRAVSVTMQIAQK